MPDERDYVHEPVDARPEGDEADESEEEAADTPLPTTRPDVGVAHVGEEAHD